MNKAKHSLLPIIQKRSLSLFVILMNILMLSFAALSYGRYASVYQERLREENLGNIANLNQSSALSATTLIDSWNIKLEDIARHVGSNTTRDEALAVIEQSNSSSDRYFELIGADYTGYLARRDDSGGFIPISYVKNAYADLQRAFDDVQDKNYTDVCFAPEFTDGYTALKHFAIYRHITLVDEQGQSAPYTLLLATKSSDILSILNRQNGFTDQATVLIDATGNYIVSSVDFKSDNFFHYLHVYNDLTLDERNAVQSQTMANDSGELYYKDAVGRDCVFRYERMPTNNWFCVTSVPLSSFRAPSFNINYALYAVAALLIMLITDLLWLQQINRRLRIGVQREKEASDAKTEFLSRMSHDIRTPLNGIIGLTTLALDEPVSPRVQEYLGNIRVSGQFLTGLVNDILDLSKVESGKVELKLEPYSCRDLCRYAEAVVHPLCREKGLDFRIQIADEASSVLLDRLRFNQIMFNLLSNAVKYTPAGGYVELRWARTDLPDNRVTLEFSVSDNGIGMSEEFQQHMFEAFSQEKSQTAKTGTGLGLAIVNSLVHLMNGTITVHSEKGGGSTFTVRLETSACAASATPTPEIENVKLSGRRALLCEDNKINVMVAQRMLEKWGIIVDTALNGRIGLDMFTASAPYTYDIILMDVMMPEMDGLTASRAIRGLKRPDAATVPILAMTANAYDTDVQNCFDAGMTAHMGKPIDQEQLREHLSSLLGGAKET